MVPYSFSPGCVCPVSSGLSRLHDITLTENEKEIPKKAYYFQGITDSETPSSSLKIQEDSSLSLTP
jgi:hypothetical protein